MEEEIFMGKEERTWGNYQIAYSDDIYSQQYVDQFLNFPDESPERSSHHDIRSHSIEDMSDQEPPKMFDESKGYHQKSAFHNFQKHLVTTLRNNIRISQKYFSNETKGIQKKLWKCFMQCLKPTRTLIFLITVQASEQNLNEDSKLQKVYGVEKIFEKFNLTIIQQAQKNLREQILLQLETMNLDNLLKSRRMKNKEEFKVYMRTFAQELKHGKFNRRIPKQMKNSLELEVRENSN